ncbi:MAG: SH3 domain-containing protein [Candidatus Eiseniibacteriota bacterium]
MSRLLAMAVLLGSSVCAASSARAQMTDPGSPVPPADSIVALGGAVAEDAPSTPPASEPQPAALGGAAWAPAPAATTPATAAAPKKAVANPIMQSIRKVKLDKSDHNVLRAGPGDAFAIAGVLPKGGSFPVIAKSGDWYDVRLSDSETAWIHSSLVTEFDDLSDLEFKANPKLYSRTGSYAISGYAGAYAFDRKSNSFLAGGRLGYYVLDRLQAEVGVAWTHVKRPAEIVETLFGLELESEEFHMLYYDLGVTFEILPGRQMVPFVTGGAGSTIMQGRSEPSYNFGAGTMLFLKKRNLVRWEVRSYRFTSGPDDERVSNSNITFTLGTSYLF